MGTLDQKVALVTGASRGIGAAVARRLAKEGAAVAITYAKGKAPAEAIVNEVVAAGGKAVALQADSADSAAVVRAVDDTVKAFGRLDILVNNAGIGIFKPFEETTDEEFDQHFDTNVRGMVVATRAALKHLKRGGRIINMGSIVGEQVSFPGMVLYASTKGAIRSFTQGLSRELGPRGITVNTIQPGPIDTEANPAQGAFADAQLPLISVGHFGHVDDVASLVAYVARDETGFINGASLTVDGGVNS